MLDKTNPDLGTTNVPGNSYWKTCLCGVEVVVKEGVFQEHMAGEPRLMRNPGTGDWNCAFSGRGAQTDA